MNYKLISDIIDESIIIKRAILDNQSLLSKIQSSVDSITECFKNGNKVLFCGNGGSAADAQHLAAEFSGRFYKDRKALPSEALHCNSSYLTAVANDYGYEFTYSRLISGIANPGDILIGITTSGNSLNIINAFNKANEMNVNTIAMTGLSGGNLKDISDILINVPSTVTPRIQEGHILIGHIICQFVEENLFP
jgi:D-sedoheptulose 7-phosphate isomerase